MTLFSAGHHMPARVKNLEKAINLGSSLAGLLILVIPLLLMLAASAASFLATKWLSWLRRSW